MQSYGTQCSTITGFVFNYYTANLHSYTFKCNIDIIFNISIVRNEKQCETLNNVKSCNV